MARSGRALDAFARWVASRRPTAWVLDVVEYLPMSTAVRDEIFDEGVLEGELKQLVRQFERRLMRELAPAERAQLAQRVREQGAERVGDLVLARTPDELAAWLAAPNSG